MNRGSRESSANITGQGYDLKTHIVVRWGYITLPALLTLGALVFVLTTMSKSIKQGVPFWKSSGTATLLLNVEQEDRDGLATSRLLSDMEARAEEVHLKLVNTGAEGTRFVICKRSDRELQQRGPRSMKFPRQ
jgi:hypothetical protein